MMLRGLFTGCAIELVVAAVAGVVIVIAWTLAPYVAELLREALP
jgi:hypothetical protein